MELNYDTIRSITLGAVEVEQTGNGVVFYRFNKSQRELYKFRNEGQFYNKALTTSGVKLSLKTNSQTLRLKINATFTATGARKYFSVDVFCNGKMVDNLCNFNKSLLPPLYTTAEFPCGDFEKTFNLGDGDKHVEIYLPCLVMLVLKEFSLDDGCYVTPVKPQKKLLAFGDSITQGYDALYPSNKYVTKLCNFLGAEEINKGIGGEIFVPELIKIKEDVKPDYVLVAYGTNDWATCKEETFIKNCKEFFKELTKKFDDSTIFAISPIWRTAEKTSKTLCGEFLNIEKSIKNTLCKHPNIKFISGYDLVPHDVNFYADKTLHPNDDGFNEYYNNLICKIK